MESSNQHDYLLNSSIDQEVDQQELEQEQEQEYYMGGVGKSYECVYCKGGFNTAQALGGHMNIHRKDKLSSSRNKPNTTTHNLLTSTTTKKHEIHNNLSSGANLRCYNVAESQSNYVTYFAASTSTSTSTNGHEIFLNQNRSINSSHDDHHNIQCLNLFGDDWGFQYFGTAATHDHVTETMDQKKSQENDLDLELRLGHDPLKQ
ncbi:zinc finger protein GIS2-like [Solanum stenotomum]|uniref:zinc finger protein GIS2-like n=1 Tax=Solanum stenotomum TaxID=172797 RepID=UPI0020D147DD|nr:zinc finger protein GIS2-like [Solanum stenotomum]